MRIPNPEARPAKWHGYKQRLFEILVGLIGLFLVLGLCTDPKKCFLLPVALHHQEQGNWCWAATEQMALDYFNVHVEQCAIVTNSEGRTSCCTDGRTPDCNVTGRPYSFLGVDFTNVNECDPSEGCRAKSFNWSTIVNKLHIEQRPFSYARKPAGAGEAHIMLVVGYAKAGGDKWLLINDPLVQPDTTAPQEIDAGTNNFIITLDTYRTGGTNDYRHWFDQTIKLH